MAKAEFADTVRKLDDPYITLTLSEREVRIIGALFGSVLSKCKDAMGIADAIGILLENEDWQFDYDNMFGDFNKVRFYQNHSEQGQTEVDNVSVVIEEIE